MPKLNTAESRFREAGFGKRGQPGEEPNFPQKVSRVKNKDLGDLMSHYEAWREYTEHLLIEASTDATIKQEEYQYEYDKTYVRSSSGTETARKRQLGANQQLMLHRQKVMDSQMFRDMLSSRAETYSDAIAVLSREISRRGFTIEQQ